MNHDKTNLQENWWWSFLGEHVYDLQCGDIKLHSYGFTFLQVEVGE